MVKGQRHPYSRLDTRRYRRMDPFGPIYCPKWNWGRPMGQQKLLGGHNGYYDPENYNCGRRKALRLIAGEQLGDVEQALAEAKNGAPILRDQDGVFSSTLTFPRGGSILTFVVTDRFGRTVTANRPIYFSKLELFIF